MSLHYVRQVSGSSELSPQSSSKSQKNDDGIQRLLVGHCIDPRGHSANIARYAR